MKSKIIFALGLLVPAFLVYKFVLFSNSLAFGDAPYFYSEAFSVFLHNPLAWWNFGDGLGGINLFIWISPIMYLYTFLGPRFTFFVPAILLSFISPIIFAKYFKYSIIVQFFSALIYGLNTYLILLIDGGQAGVALAYSFFPLVILAIYKFITTQDSKSFIKAFAWSSVLFFIDPRVAIISFLTVLIWKPKKIFGLILLGLSLVPLNLFWLLPLYKNGGGSLSLDVSSLGFVRWFNPLLLYQPHWPNNVYGQTTIPPIYFVFIPLFVFVGFLFRRTRENRQLIVFAFLFLAFAFLSKGENIPFGSFYKFMVEKIPFGSTLRDSTKFFIPLILFAGILIGNTMEKIKFYWLQIAGYIILIALLLPALFGKLNFVLSGKSQSPDYQKIYEKLKIEAGDYKTLWFPEKPTLGFYSLEKPAINAKSLVNLRPFASLNVGSADPFNYLNKPEAVNWFKVLGIKYMFLPNDTRRITFTEEDNSNWTRLVNNILENSYFKPLSWNTEMLAFEVPDYKDKSFTVSDLFAVVGGDDVYDRKNIDPTKSGTIFLEDGKTDMEEVLKLDAGSMSLIYLNKDVSDLQFSFLQKYFLNQENINLLEWAKYTTDQYLLWKYQLLIRGIENKEYDYQRGILLSTNRNEQVSYPFEAAEEGKYVIGIRGMGYKDNKLIVKVGGLEKELIQKEGSFGWKYFEIELKKGSNEITIANENGTQIVNTVAIVPVNDWEDSRQKAVGFEAKFLNNKKDNNQQWLIYSENFHPLMQLDCNGEYIKPMPIYSMINGYNIKKCPGSMQPTFVGQKYVDLGIKISWLYFAIISLWAIYTTRFSL